MKPEPQMPVVQRNAGFRYGRHSLRVVNALGEVRHDGRTYRLIEVETQDGLRYLSLRLYNPAGHFIKQFLFEPELAPRIADLLKDASRP